MANIKITKHKDSKRIDFEISGNHYHTNDAGCGLWLGDDYARQVEGTAQFRLMQKTTSGIRKAIVKHFIGDWG